ncbi:MAG TPA: hypothetical protein EYP09_08265 [Anaerolineae bacterium]|nr:hypothetical protein [Anaerolineae bacterium]
MILRFIIYGALGWCGEIVWTATKGKLSGQQRDWKLRGTTYLWMFPIYGLLVLLYESAHDAVRAWPWPFRGITYMVGFWAAEYLAGWALKLLIGVCPWDYSRARWHVRGLIRLDYGPVWFLAGLGLEPVHELLVRLTPAIQQALTR